MAERFLPHLQGKKCGELVAIESHDRPLLPYEWGIIQALGVSEQEYREIFQQLAEKARERPAGYEHIPDVAAEPFSTTAFLVNLAIGLVLTGVSLLLAPKPPSQQGREDEPSQVNLANQTGRTRFNETVGFDGTPQLAKLGSRIPLIFGQYRSIGSDFISTSGGLIGEPLLIWSRLISKGTYQNFKGVYVLSEWGLDTTPTIESFMMGGQPIDDIYSTNYELFFSSVAGSNILNGTDHTIGGSAAPTVGDVFTVVPQYSSSDTKGFCEAFSPRNKNVFGVSDAHRNGGRVSLNWRIVPFNGRPKGDDTNFDDPGDRIQARRRKITGKGADRQEQGMQGTGRWYSPQMGIATHNGSTMSDSPITVQLNDEVTFEITNRTFRFKDGDLEKDPSAESDAVTYDDINSMLNTLRSNADSALVPGEIFCINQTLLMVTQRNGFIFQPAKKNEDTNRTVITLKVVGFTGKNHQIAGAAPAVFSSVGVMREFDSIEPGAREANYFSLLKMDIAQIRNTRICEVTEIGIKSRVYTRINGLCNFAEIPAPDKLKDMEEDLITVTSGTTNKYADRTSFFTIGVKVSDDAQYGGELVDGYDVCETAIFAVRGSSPVDQFNFIRIKPSIPNKYEYRLIPLTSTHVYRYFPTNQPIHVLSDLGSLQTHLFRPENMPSMVLEFKAKTEFLGIGVAGYDPILDLREYISAPKGFPGSTFKFIKRTYSQPHTLRAEGNFPETYQRNHKQAWLEKIFGVLKSTTNPGSEPRTLFGEMSDVVKINFFQNGVRKAVNLQAQCVKDYMPNSLDVYGTGKSWAITKIEFNRDDSLTSESDLGKELIIEDVRIDDDEGWYWNFMPRDSRKRTINMTLQVDESLQNVFEKVDSDDYREFENYGQVKEISAYQEVTRSCDDGPEHEVVYVNQSDSIYSETLNDFQYQNMTTVGIKLKSMNQTQQLQQLQVYLKNGIHIPQLGRNDQVGPTDLLSDVMYFLMTAQGRGMLDTVPEELINKRSFEKTGRFLACNELRFNGAIADRINLRTYIAQIAPYFLVNFSIRNGKYFMSPAVPTDDAGALLTTAVPLKGLFNDGNIVDGSFDLNYLNATERRDFRSVMKYRESVKNSLPEQFTIQGRWADRTYAPDQEDHDMTGFCTTEWHAKLAAKYLLSTRRRIDHTIEFQTSPYGIDLAPGDYIKVDVSASPIEAANNVVVSATGEVRAGMALVDGSYNAVVYRQGAETVTEEEVAIAGGRVLDSGLYGALFNIPLAQRRLGVYMIEELSMTETGMVSIKAAHHPVNADGVSKINLDLLIDGRFTFV